MRDLDLPVDAAHGAQQDVVGVVVRGRAAVGAGAVALVVPRADQEHVADDDPAPARAPARLQHHRARQVAASRRHAHAGRREPEAPRVAVEHRPEDARRVHARQAQPLHAPARGHESGRLAVRQEAVVGDGRERAARQGARYLAVPHVVAWSGGTETIERGHGRAKACRSRPGAPPVMRTCSTGCRRPPPPRRWRRR